MLHRCPCDLVLAPARARRSLPRRRWFAAWLALSLLVSCRDEQAPASRQDKPAGKELLKIAVIPKGTTHEFWKAVHAGAVKASRELGVEIVWKGPLREDDLKSQIDLVQSFTAQGVSGIALAPLNDSALRVVVANAVRAEVPVVVFDSDLKGQAHASFVATDNRAAGRLAGEAMVQALNGAGNLLVLRYQEGSASTHHREEGFLAAVRKHPGIKVVSDNQYGGATTESALSASESVLLAQGAAQGKIDGIFCPNESTTFGMLLALKKARLAGTLQFIGFDASEKLIAGLSSKEIQGLVLQDPFNMGYLSIKTMVKVLRNEPVEKRIDTGSALVTASNMDEPEMQRLLKPEVDQWLKP